MCVLYLKKKQDMKLGICFSEIKKNIENLRI